MNYIYNQDDFATEPVRGLPAALPPGEFVLWQGAPDWRAFARQVYHTRALAILVGLAATIRIAVSVNAGTTLGTAIGEAGIIVAFGAVGIGMLSFLAWLVQKTTVYTITNKRVMMRIGVALQKTFNIPFAQIDGAALFSNRKDFGNISLSLKPGVAIAYLILWPHVRPWRMSQSQPTLRAIPRAGRVAQLLTDAFTSHVATSEAIDRSRLALAADGAPPLADDDTVQEKLKDAHIIPKPMAMLAAATAVVTVITVGLAQWADLDAQRANDGTPVFEQSLQFVDGTGDQLSVLNAETGAVITSVEGAGDGLLRNAVRGLRTKRVQANQDPAAPFLLQRFADDGVYLTDPLTNNTIRLESFGPAIQLGATNDLIQLGHTATAASN